MLNDRPSGMHDVTGAVPLRERLVAFVRERWELVALVVCAVAPLVVPALGGALGGQHQGGRCARLASTMA